MLLTRSTALAALPHASLRRPDDGRTVQELRLDAVGKLADLSAELGRILRELRGRVCQHLPLSFVEEKTLVPLVLAVDQVSEAGEMLGDGWQRRRRSR